MQVPAREAYEVKSVDEEGNDNHVSTRCCCRSVRMTRMTPDFCIYLQVSLARILQSRGPAACIDSAAASAYLNRPEVMEAIHVRDPGFCWAICNTAKVSGRLN